jgi:hypothetical protein
VQTYLLLLLVILRDIKDRGHVVAEAELLQRSLDVLASYCLLRVLLGNLVGFGGNECDELNAAFNQEVARVFRKGRARFAR